MICSIASSSIILSVRVSITISLYVFLYFRNVSLSMHIPVFLGMCPFALYDCHLFCMHRLSVASFPTYICSAIQTLQILYKINYWRIEKLSNKSCVDLNSMVDWDGQAFSIWKKIPSSIWFAHRKVSTRYWNNNLHKESLN